MYYITKKSMNKMKNIMILMIVLISLTCYTTANDCGIVESDINWNFKMLENWDDNWARSILMPKAAMKKALLNLKSFCCDRWIANKEKCSTDSAIDTDGIYPSSAYLYDHILDISMRRLDAKQENNNWDDLIYGLEPDKSGLEWREFITEHGNNKNGSIPLAISEKFKTYREAQSNMLDSWSPNDSDLPWSENDFKNYSERRLVEKYLWVCETSLYLYLKSPGEKDKIKLNKAYLNCKKLSNNRIKNEVNYTKAILMQKWNTFLYNNIQSYLDTYFVQNKLVALQEIIFNIQNTFNEINKGVPELVPNCS